MYWLDYRILNLSVWFVWGRQDDDEEWFTWFTWPMSGFDEYALNLELFLGGILCSVMVNRWRMRFHSWNTTWRTIDHCQFQTNQTNQTPKYYIRSRTHNREWLVYNAISNIKIHLKWSKNDCRSSSQKKKEKISLPFYSLRCKRGCRGVDVLWPCLIGL